MTEVPATLSKFFPRNKRGDFIPIRPLDRMLTTAQVKITKELSDDEFHYATGHSYTPQPNVAEYYDAFQAYRFGQIKSFEKINK